MVCSKNRPLLKSQGHLSRLILAYRAVCLGLFLVAHRHDGQHQVDEVKRSEKYDDGKKYHMDWSAGGHDLKGMESRVVNEEVE